MNEMTKLITLIIVSMILVITIPLIMSITNVSIDEMIRIVLDYR